MYVHNVQTKYEYKKTLLKYVTKMAYSQSQSYVTTDGQPASLSWNKAPIWSLRPDLYYCQTVTGLSSLTRGRVCRLQSHSQQ
jgi:hypothetical protein